jgi:hypothetical protein
LEPSDHAGCLLPSSDLCHIPKAALGALTIVVDRSWLVRPKLAMRMKVSGSGALPSHLTIEKDATPLRPSGAHLAGNLEGPEARQLPAERHPSDSFAYKCSLSTAARQLSQLSVLLRRSPRGYNAVQE